MRQTNVSNARTINESQASFTGTGDHSGAIMANLKGDRLKQLAKEL